MNNYISKFDSFPTEILIKILLFIDITEIKQFKILLNNYQLFEDYVYNILLSSCIEKQNQRFSLTINFNDNYTLSFSEMNLDKIKNLILHIFKNKNYKILLNNWYCNKLKF
tara:strand:+ start:1587 stop:1919 length:333 start_codon:yes stop_codon:yes gene_type:complete